MQDKIGRMKELVLLLSKAGKAYYQEIHRAGCSHCCQGPGAKKFSYDYCICHVVKLLDYVSYKERH